MQGSRWKSGGLSGDRLTGHIGHSFRWTPRHASTAFVGASHATLEGARIYGGDLGIGHSVQLVVAGPDQPWSWQLSPFAQAALRASAHLAAGGAIWSAGANSRLAYRLNRTSQLAWIAQGSAFGGISVEIGGYQLDRAVDQQILTNAVEWVWHFHPASRLEYWLADTRFLREAALQHYQDGGLRVAWQLSPGWRLRLGGEAHESRSYRSRSLQGELRWHF